MILTENYLADLIYYLKTFEKIYKDLPLGKKMFKEGITAGQIFFHTTQAVNYWLRVTILEQEYPRNRDLEFKKQPTLKDIKISLKKALEICKELPKYKFHLDKKIKNAKTVEPANFKIETINAALFHITVHTAEHFGELHLLVDK